jgi:hypothetical protein
MDDVFCRLVENQKDVAKIFTACFIMLGIGE